MAAALERAELEDVYERAMLGFLAVRHTAGELNDYVVRVTSGTSGEAPLVSVRRVSKVVDKKWFGGEMRTAFFVGSTSAMLFFTKLHLTLGNSAASSLAVSHAMRGSLAEPLEALMPQCVLGIPSFIAECATEMSDKARGRVTNIHHYGEPLSEAMESLLRSLFPSARLAGMYASAETGPISTVFCPHLRRNEYHPLPGVAVRVADEDDGVGDLRIDMEANVFDGIPIRDYEIGDIGRLRRAPCACGASETFEILGRRGFDYVRMLGATFRQEEFDRVAALLAEYDDYRVELSASRAGAEMRGNITLSVFREGAPFAERDTERIAEHVARELFVTPTRTLAELIAEGRFAPIIVRAAREPFPHRAKNVKLLQRV